MTVFIMLEEIETGHLKPHTPIRISTNAAKQPASHIGLRKYTRIPAHMALKALIIKSANDVATAVAEHISGTETHFAMRMTKTARKLKMTKTTFANASGLYHRHQRTTASDMARLVKALLERFPHFQTLWNVQAFNFNGKRYISHNRLPRILPGSLGMKTGYIRASGYSIATAVERNGRRVIIVLIGGRTALTRDRQVVSLAERTLARAQPLKNTASVGRTRRVQVSKWLSHKQNTASYKKRNKPKRVRDWEIQVGAFRVSRLAIEHLNYVRRSLGNSLDKAAARTELVTTNGRQIYRARFANLSEAEAFNICRRLQNLRPGCLPIAP